MSPSGIKGSLIDGPQLWLVTTIAESQVGLKYPCANFVFATVDMIFQHKEFSGGLRRDSNTHIPFQPSSPAVPRGAACMFT